MIFVFHQIGKIYARSKDDGPKSSDIIAIKLDPLQLTVDLDSLPLPARKLSKSRFELDF